MQYFICLLAILNTFICYGQEVAPIENKREQKAYVDKPQSKPSDYKIAHLNIDSLTKSIISASDFHAVHQKYTADFDSLKVIWISQVEKQLREIEGSCTLTQTQITQLEIMLKCLDNCYGSLVFFTKDSLSKAPQEFQNKVAYLIRNDIHNIGEQEQYDFIIDTSDIPHSDPRLINTFALPEGFIQSFDMSRLIENFEQELDTKYRYYIKSYMMCMP